MIWGSRGIMARYKIDHGSWDWARGREAGGKAEDRRH